MNWESLLGDAPLLPLLMNINAEKRAGKLAGKFGLNRVDPDSFIQMEPTFHLDIMST